MEIWPKIYSKMVAAAILNFKNAILDSQLPPQIAHIYLHTKSGANRSTIIGRDMPVCVFSKMTAAAILDFKNAIWDFLCPSVCPYLSAHQIWCKTANWPTVGRDMPSCVYSKVMVAAILELLFSRFEPPMISLLVGCMFLTNGVMISMNLRKIIRSYHFPILAGKCLFPLIFGGFGEFRPPKIIVSSF